MLTKEELEMLKPFKPIPNKIKNQHKYLKDRGLLPTQPKWKAKCWIRRIKKLEMNLQTFVLQLKIKK